MSWASLAVDVLLALFDPDHVDHDRAHGWAGSGCGWSLLDSQRVTRAGLLRSAQVSDVYLLALAVEHCGRFVTFDRTIAVGAVPRAESRHLVVLGAQWRHERA